MATRFYLSVVVIATVAIYCDASGHTRDSAERQLQSVLPNAQETVAFVGISGGKAYFRDSNNKTVNFAEYVQFCQVNQMRTASVMNAQENEILTNYFSDTGYWDLFWLGGWDINTEGKFHWLDNNKPFNYTHWYYDVPSESRYANCVYMVRSGYWMDGNCQESTGGRVSLCELQLTA